MEKPTLKLRIKSISKDILPPFLFRGLMAIRERPSKPSWREVHEGALKGREVFIEQDGAGDKIVMGTYDGLLFSILKGLSLSAGELVLDIGGHIGYHTLSFAAMFPKCRVISFEPVPVNLQRIKLNCEKNSDLAARIFIKPVAVGRDNGTVEMMVSTAENGGLTSMGFISGVGKKLHTRKSSDYTQFVPVAVDRIALDTSEVFSQGKVAVIKIDVEGSEVDVIMGARALIKRDRPLLFIELHSVALAVEAMNELASLGYKAVVVEDQSRSRCVISATPV